VRNVLGWVCVVGFLLAGTGATAVAESPAPAAAAWTPCGWGGGGFYWSAVFDPAQDGVIYMGGDVLGVYKTQDHGRHWRVINNGLVNYGVYSLAVDRKNPGTIYAATEGGLCKSTDGGALWQVLPHTGPAELRLTGERNKSIRAIAVDPSDGQVVYAASPGGRVYKSTDGGQAWKVAYEKKGATDAAACLRAQLGKVNGEWYGGLWLGLSFPKGATPADGVGFGFSFKGEGNVPRDVFVTLKTTAGATYRSKNQRELFQGHEWRDVVLTGADFTIDPQYAKDNPEKCKSLPTSPDWATVNRMDFAAVGSLPTESSIAQFGRVFFALKRTADGTAAPADKPFLATVHDFSTSKVVQHYGNIALGAARSGGIYSVTVAPKDPHLVLAATDDAGLIRSQDGGATWQELPTPQKASSVMVAATDSNIIYGSFFTDGIWKSTDQGNTWTRISQGLGKGGSITEVAASPANAQDVYAIGSVGWSGASYSSHDGGQSWQTAASVADDTESGDPTLPGEMTPKTGLSTPTNIAINPLNPQELYISANWRPCLSADAGRTWTERVRGADISCIYDIAFRGGRTYASAMDEGTLMSEDQGQTWRQLWPRKYDAATSGHNWRLALTDNNGVERIISTVSPWDTKYPPRVIVSEDGGKTCKVITAGLPDYVIQRNTMWGTGYPRALAVDPKNSRVVYLGIDGDAGDGKPGGGVFKSEDGGYHWKQLPQQPTSRRAFFGLAVDPTDSQRIYWGACGDKGGLYCSPDGGASWHHVFANESWLFNILVTADGTVYCPGKNLWRSTDHGASWKQLTHFAAANRVLVALEADPRDARTLWIGATSWDGSSDGAVYKTTDGGATWQDITGNLPYRKPIRLRFNTATNELWAGGVGLFKIRQ